MNWRFLHRLVFLAATWAVGLLPLAAADFQFSTMIQAGLPSNGDWELGAGPTASASASTSHLNPYYQNNVPQQFQIGYSQAANRAYVRFHNGSGASYTQVNYTIPYTLSPGAKLTWEIPTGSLYVGASSRSRFTSVTIDQLSLSGAMTVLQPLTTTSLTAWQLQSNMTSGTAAPVVFQTAGSGDWLLTGRISFQGLNPYVSGGARRSELHMGFTAMATVASPEATTWLSAGTGLLAGALVQGMRKKRMANRPA